MTLCRERHGGADENRRQVSAGCPSSNRVPMEGAPGHGPLFQQLGASPRIPSRHWSRITARTLGSGGGSARARRRSVPRPPCAGARRRRSGTRLAICRHKDPTRRGLHPLRGPTPVRRDPLLAPKPPLMIDRVPGREGLGQAPPLAACPQSGEDRREPGPQRRWTRQADTGRHGLSVSSATTPAASEAGT
jgi:hypothetical protein